MDFLIKNAKPWRDHQGKKGGAKGAITLMTPDHLTNGTLKNGY